MIHIFTEDEITKLKLYLESVENIRNSSFYKHLKEKGLSIQLSSNRLKNPTNFPSEESIKAFMVDFCQIYLQEQNANYAYICNILNQAKIPVNIKKIIISIRKEYNLALNKPNLKIGLTSDHGYSSLRDVFWNWTMGYYRHNNKIARDEILKWENKVTGLYKFILLRAIGDLLYPIFKLEAVINDLLK